MQVSHVAVEQQKQTKIRTLSQCLTLYLNLPDMLTATDWTVRPLDADCRRATAQNVAFLFTLQQYLLHERMLRPYYEECKSFGGIHLVNEEAVDEALFDIVSTNNYGMDKLMPIKLATDDVDAINDLLTSLTCNGTTEEEGKNKI